MINKQYHCLLFVYEIGGGEEATVLYPVRSYG